MSIVVGGVTIPENVAGALVVGGVSITQVIVDGVQVWLQSLGPSVGWSGNSIDSLATISHGYQVSGMSWRYASLAFNSTYSTWTTVNPDGTFGLNTTGGWINLGFSGSLYRHTSGSGNSTTSTTWVTYNPTTKQFTGSTVAVIGGVDSYLGETLSGLLRFNFVSGSNTTAGAWISLT